MQKVLEELAAYFHKRGDLSEEAGYLVKLLALTKDTQREAVIGSLLAIYLRQSRVDQAVPLLQSALNKGDLAPQGPLVLAIEDYLNGETDKENHLKVVDAVLKKVTIKEARPNWDQFRQQWLERLVKAGESAPAAGQDQTGT